MKIKDFFYVIVLLFYSCAENPEVDDLVNYSYQVRYKVEGSALVASISIMDENSESKIFSNELLPWEYEFEKRGFEPRYLYISAQHNQSQGNIIVVIYIDQDVFRSDTSSGEYAKATAFGTF